MRAVLVILLIAGIAALALGVGLISGEWDTGSAATSDTPHAEGGYGNAEACFTCHQYEPLSWNAPGVVPIMQGTVMEPASILRDSPTTEALPEQTDSAPDESASTQQP